MRYYDTRHQVEAVQWTGDNVEEVMARFGSRYNVNRTEGSPGLSVSSPYNTPLLHGDWLTVDPDSPHCGVGIVPPEEFSRFRPIPDDQAPTPRANGRSHSRSEWRTGR